MYLLVQAKTFSHFNEVVMNTKKSYSFTKVWAMVSGTKCRCKWLKQWVSKVLEMSCGKFNPTQFVTQHEDVKFLNCQSC